MDSVETDFGGLLLIWDKFSLINDNFLTCAHKGGCHHGKRSLKKATDGTSHQTSHHLSHFFHQASHRLPSTLGVSALSFKNAILGSKIAFLRLNAETPSIARKHDARGKYDAPGQAKILILKGYGNYAMMKCKQYKTSIGKESVISENCETKQMMQDGTAISEKYSRAPCCNICTNKKNGLCRDKRTKI